MENQLPLDDVWQLAVALMQRAVGVSDPNPRVGCVLVNAQGQVIGEGHTQAAGGAHAEVMALRNAQARGLAAQGATAYVTLEPCAHTGRTPPCVAALVTAQVSKVLVAWPDPNPLVAGRGIAHLQAAGIDVEVLPSLHPAAVASREWNIGFLSRMVRQRPWIRLKMAASIDGFTALADGSSQWITSESARADGHGWRARASGLMTGVGTVLADDPRLNVRHAPMVRQPWRVVMDSHWRTPPQAALFQSSGAVCLVGLPPEDAAAQLRRAALEAAGAETIALPAGRTAQSRKPAPDLQALIPWLVQKECNELHVEAGATLNGALMDAGLADECLLYIAPKWLGAGQNLAHVLPVQNLDTPAIWRWQAATMVHDNVRLLARRVGADAF